MKLLYTPTTERSKWTQIRRKDLKTDQIGWEFNPANPPKKFFGDATQFSMQNGLLYYRYIDKKTLQPFLSNQRIGRWRDNCDCSTCLNAMCWVEII